ncbi:hypothetical protein, partial [Oribacterium sp. P6A1]|uniref:hypothetical protein n=1 Tax=Oribacterium sp. P6A1 TaxID=1410612 RepID=UPI001A9A41F6
GNSDAAQPARLVSALAEIKRKCLREAHLNGIFSDFMLRAYSSLSSSRSKLKLGFCSVRYSLLRINSLRLLSFLKI